MRVALLIAFSFGLALADDIIVVTGWNRGQTDDTDVYLEDGGDDCSIPNFPVALQAAVGHANQGAFPFVCGGILG